MPHYLRRWPPPSTKDSFPDWDVPGYTIVPNEVFYKFSTPSGKQAKSESKETATKKNDSEVKKQRLSRHEALVKENFEVGFLFASKPLVQAIANPFVGTISSK